MAATTTSASPYIRHQAHGSSLWILTIIGMVGLAVALGLAIAYGDLNGFYVAVSVVAAIAVLFDFRIGAVLLVMLLPFGATHFMPHGMLGVPGLNPLNVVIAATLGSFILRGGKLAGFAPAPLLWLYMIPILLAGLNGMRHAHQIAPFFLEAENPPFTEAVSYMRDMVIRPLLIPVVALLVGAAAARSQKPERFITAVIASVWLIALFEIGFIAASGVRLGLLASPSSRRFFDEMGLHANDLGRLFAVAYAVLLFVWWEAKRPALKGWLFVTLGVASVAMVLTFSRGALFGFFVVNALFLVWKFNARLLGLALLAAAVVALLAPEYLWNRITFGFDADANTVTADRLEGIWVPMLPELWKSPIWGNGIASIMWAPPVLAGTMDPVGHPHNAYLEAYLDMGAVGLALLLAYYVHVWRGFRVLGSNAYLSGEMRGFFQGATAGLICFLVTGGAGSSFRPEPEFAFLWLAIGMMYGVLARKPTT